MSDPASAAWPASPRADFIGALILFVFGTVVAAMSWQMDRFEQQGATLHTAPGLWPGIIGLMIVALAALLAWRSVHRARAANWNAAVPDDTVLVPRRDFWLAVALFFFYAAGLVGRGLPFWLGTAAFVAGFVFLFQRAAGRPTNARAIVFSIVCGVLTAVIVTLAFEQLFYVRLP